ncbi:PAS domain S-box-containing protein/diguanylate cyclase (GGDEF)-like protein [Hydrogenivirga caldilitoris]|uniref:PAS domain S-box-containing protein/diguanylate cyclase (GGDEF)-like protein n=1 Tax=Hydrogenivirga caldilitoris TaxID=246264 RepID=A0A497XM83_9AQUI|nr:EAL domain-containing protein [Hydrogenivirga caldilitoris]RLJ69965.1 PAS domain S-box-containing protein/diguanylate cyclase (GGDEF)-like protein [Hydrogenivirga caldilitoris]
MIKGKSLFLEIINDIIYMVRIEGSQDPATAKVEYINSRVKELTGYEPKDFISDPSLWVNLVHPEDVDSVLRVTLKLLKEKEPQVREYRVRTRKGNYIWVEDRIIPILEKRKLVGFVGVARDITRRKTLEELTLLALELDLRELFNRAVSLVREAFNADLVVIYEVPEGEREGVLRAGIGVERKLIDRYRLPLQEGTEFYYTYTSQKPVVVKDVDKEKRFKFTPDTYLLGLKSGLCIPIREEEPYGTLCVYFREARDFTKEELDFVNSISNILGLATKRHRYKNRLEDSERKLQKANRLYKTLSVISEVILKERELKALFLQVCIACTTFGGFKAAWAGLFRNSHFEVFSSCGDTGDFFREVEAPLLERIEEGVGPCGKAFLTGDIVVNNDTKTSVKERELRESMLKRGFLSSASVPLRRNGKVIGLLVLYAGEKDFFDEETVRLVREIGEALSFSIVFIEKEKELNTLSLAIEQTSDWVLITDKEGVIQYVNRAVTDITGYSQEELLGQTPRIFKSGKHTRSFYKKLWEKLLSGERFSSVFINRDKRGKVFYLDQTITPIKDSSGEVVGFVSTGKDITHERELQDRLNYIAYYDPVTELPNRVNFIERLKFALSRLKLTGRSLAVLFIDVDRFKYVNDTYGYLVGDGVLKEIARRMRSSLREGDTVARLGSDEFGVILTDLARKEDIPRVMEKLFSAMEEPIVVDGKEVIVTLSVGISIFPDDGSDAEDLVKKAEMALAHAKEDIRNSYQFFKEDMNVHITEFVLLERHLFRALDRGEFVIHYQPYYDLKGMIPSGVEALLRWNSEDIGFVFPSRFIPVLESTGLIVKVGEWLLGEVCETIKRIEKPVSVNISPVQFKDKTFPKRVEQVLERHGVDGSFLTLEITESTLMEDVEFAQRSLKRLKSLGVKVAIDDFGTGYSSLAYLKFLPVDFLKIDVSFVREIDTDPDDRAIVNAIIQLAKNLGLRTIAEGIESEEHLQILKELGCDFGQGYFLGKPMPEGEVMRVLGL